MIAIGSDHAGFSLKERIKQALKEQALDFVDLGCPDEQPSDYPDVGKEVARGVSEGRCDRGVLICGSGIGMSIVANRQRGVRAALCHDEETARMSRLHNDANILVIGSRLTSPDLALRILRVWLATGFEGGRHLRRINKIDGGQA
ncbi:MAG: ribose 5-phosphate isomerase B [Acidobacteriota bacterium]